ncbi:MAG: hypothetical protein WD851_03465 [Pirellulales bacterium]
MTTTMGRFTLFNLLLGVFVYSANTAHAQRTDWNAREASPFRGRVQTPRGRVQTPTQSHNDSGPSAPEILGGVLKITDALIREGQRQPQPNISSQPRRPRYYEPQPEYRPSFPPPERVAPARPKPPKNEVVSKKKPPTNTVKLDGLIARRASAETDARQLVENGKSKNLLDAAVSGYVGSSKDQQLQDDWAIAIQQGLTTDEVDQFLTKHGASGSKKLPLDIQEQLELRQKFGRYGDALNNGTLTANGKDQALQELQQSVATLGGKQGWDPKFLDNMNSNVTQMQNFNTMGKIADATQATPNPFPTLVEGATQIGMPVMFVSEMTGFPVMPVPPLPDTAASAAAASIVIHNPAGNGQSVSYLLDTHKFDMAPGSQQQLDRSYQISFDSGIGGQKRYRLADGVYEWRDDPRSGWNLYRVKVNVVIDNSRYDGEFRYLLNNESKSVAPGEVVEHSSEKPMQLAFDSGKGGAEIRKTLKNGRYIVGIDPNRGVLDLFDAEKVDAAEAEHPAYLSSTLVAGNNATPTQRVEALLSQLKPVGGRAPTDAGPGNRIVSPVGDAKSSAQSVESLLNSLKQAGPAGG